MSIDFFAQLTRARDLFVDEIRFKRQKKTFEINPKVFSIV
jgi:hypothetical protein